MVLGVQDEEIAGGCQLWEYQESEWADLQVILDNVLEQKQVTLTLHQGPRY